MGRSNGRPTAPAAQPATPDAEGGRSWAKGRSSTDPSCGLCGKQLLEEEEEHIAARCSRCGHLPFHTPCVVSHLERTLKSSKGVCSQRSWESVQVNIKARPHTLLAPGRSQKLRQHCPVCLDGMIEAAEPVKPEAARKLAVPPPQPLPPPPRAPRLPPPVPAPAKKQLPALQHGSSWGGRGASGFGGGGGFGGVGASGGLGGGGSGCGGNGRSGGHRRSTGAAAFQPDHPPRNALQQRQAQQLVQQDPTAAAAAAVELEEAQRRAAARQMALRADTQAREEAALLLSGDALDAMRAHKCRLAAVHLLEMGFEWSTALAAVEAAGGSADLAVHLLTGAALEGVPDCAPANVTKEARELLQLGVVLGLAPRDVDEALREADGDWRDARRALHEQVQQAQQAVQQAQQAAAAPITPGWDSGGGGGVPAPQAMGSYGGGEDGWQVWPDDAGVAGAAQEWGGDPVQPAAASVQYRQHPAEAGGSNSGGWGAGEAGSSWAPEESPALPRNKLSVISAPRHPTHTVTPRRKRGGRGGRRQNAPAAATSSRGGSGWVGAEAGQSSEAWEDDYGWSSYPPPVPPVTQRQQARAQHEQPLSWADEVDEEAASSAEDGWGEEAGVEGEASEPGWGEDGCWLVQEPTAAPPPSGHSMQPPQQHHQQGPEVEEVVAEWMMALGIAEDRQH